MANTNEGEWAGSDAPSDHFNADTRPQNTAAIRAEIEDTRSRMSGTMDEIGERLNPNVMKEKVKDSIREATIGRVETMARDAADKMSNTGRSIGDTIRENPIPAVMVGIGLAWLLLGRRRDDAPGRPRYQMQDDRDWSRNRRYDAEESGETETLQTSRDRVEELVGTVKDKAGHLADRARETAGQVTDRAKDAAEQAKDAAERVGERARDVADRVGERARDLAGDVRQTSRRRGSQRVQDTYFENPLAVGAVTMALGLAVGFSVPETDAEVSLMGDKRNALVEKARDIARDRGEKVKHVAERVIDEGKRVAKEVAREEGLTKA